jgi:hypothetical protein
MWPHAIWILAMSPIAEGRGSNPSEVGGVALIVGIAALVAIAAFGGLWLVTRRRGRS